MRLICRPKGIMNPLSPAQGMKDIKAAGFDASMLDVSAICTEQEIDNLRRNNFRRVAGVVYLTEQPERLLEETQRLLVKTAGNAGVEIDTALAPYAAPDIKLDKELPANAERINEIYRRLGKESLKAAIAAGCKRIIVQPLFAGLSPKEEWEVNRSFYMELAETADELGSDIRILLVNRARSINGHLIRGICAEPEESCRWVDELNETGLRATRSATSDTSGVIADIEKDSASDADHSARFAFCFDVGTATLCGQDFLVPVYLIRIWFIQLFRGVRRLTSEVKSSRMDILRYCCGMAPGMARGNQLVQKLQRNTRWVISLEYLTCSTLGM